MTTLDALQTLGVNETTLTNDEKAQLDRDGFLPLYGVLTPEQMDGLREVLARLANDEGENAGKEVHQEAGTERLANLVNKDPQFDVCFTHPRVLAGIAHVLGGDLKLSSLNARAALPGEGLQALHADWSRAVAPNAYEVCNSIWLLDDFTPDNGATRVVPGSHLSGKAVGEVLSDPKETHEGEKLLAAPAGTVVVFNSHTWHGGTRNQTNKPRRALHSYFTKRHNPQQLDQSRYVTPETRARLSEAARFILDV